jgi:hypothetical protein
MKNLLLIPLLLLLAAPATAGARGAAQPHYGAEARDRVTMQDMRRAVAWNADGGTYRLSYCSRRRAARIDCAVAYRDVPMDVSPLGEVTYTGTDHNALVLRDGAYWLHSRWFEPIRVPRAALR